MTGLPQELLSTRLEEALSDVAVEPGGRTASVGERLMTAPTPRALTGQLATALYQTVHVGRRPAEPGGEEDRAPGTGLEDRDLEAGLATGVPHRHSRYRARVLSATGGGPVVHLSGVRVRVAPERIADGTAREEGTAPGAEADVLVAAARRSLSPGFFLVDGSLPLAHQDSILRVYLHVETPSVVFDAWGRSLRCLEEHGVPYRAKAISYTGGLPRRDGVVIYLGSEHQGLVGDLVGSLKGIALGAGASPFTQPLAPGIAMAWEPADPRPRMKNTSLGEHRSRAVAAGLVQHATQPDDAPLSRSEVVRQALLDAGIDPSEPARNLSSPPFPGSLKSVDRRTTFHQKDLVPPPRPR
ncbi:T3SS effector HopA1 family protein [Streptomyces sp. NPDC051662]|uniref:T3SS effector HopA1 family protein n=1 Tax=Streptomyces sp. NPDC051662 TaxID=3154750 RepID=UPI003413C731